MAHLVRRWSKGKGKRQSTSNSKAVLSLNCSICDIFLVIEEVVGGDCYDISSFYTHTPTHTESCTCMANEINSGNIIYIILTYIHI